MDACLFKGERCHILNVIGVERIVILMGGTMRNPAILNVGDIDISIPVSPDRDNSYSIPQALIYIDGIRQVVNTPAQIKNVPVGDHKVTLKYVTTSKIKYKDFTGIVTVTAGRISYVRVCFVISTTLPP